MKTTTFKGRVFTRISNKRIEAFYVSVTSRDQAQALIDDVTATANEITLESVFAFNKKPQVIGFDHELVRDMVGNVCGVVFRIRERDMEKIAQWVA